MEHSMTYFEPFPVLDSAPTTTTTTTTTTSAQHAHDAPPVELPEAGVPPEERFQVEYEGPLYTEINIPLPRIPTAYANSAVVSRGASASTSRGSAAGSTTSTEGDTEASRSRSRTLSSLSPFRLRRFSSSSITAAATVVSTSTTTSTTSPTSPKSASSRHSDDWPRVRRDVVKSREVNAMMDLRHQGKKRSRNATIDALAVVPAVLVLSAELFTPGEGKDEGARRKDSGVGRWEDGIR